MCASELTQAEEALRVAEEAVAVSRIAALERRAKPVRKASRAVRASGTAGGLRYGWDDLLFFSFLRLEDSREDLFFLLVGDSGTILLVF